MKPVEHGAISLAIGAGVWAATGSASAVGVAIGVGVLMDADHLLDYYYWYKKGRRDKVLVLCHAWEYSLFGLVAFLVLNSSPPFLAGVLAHLAHLVADQVANKPYRYTYSLIYRINHGFKADVVAPWNLTTAYTRLTQSIPFGKYLEPWFERKVQK